MTNDLLRRSLVTASLLVLSACATYPTRYSHGGDGAPATLTPPCRAALGGSASEGGDHESLSNCLIQRAGAWERLARNNRGATRAAGALAILATGTGIGLAAEGDPNHAIVPLGLLTGAAVTGARSYASPEQAVVAEKAVAAYNCLISAVAELRAGDNMPAIRMAHDRLAAEFAVDDPRAVAGIAGLRGAAIQAPELIRSLKATVGSAAVRAQMDDVAADAAQFAVRAAAASRRIEAARANLRSKGLKLDVAFQQALSQASQADARLLRQSDIIDEAAIDQITKQEPSVYAVAASARDSILDVAGRTHLAGAETNQTADVAAMAPDDGGPGVVETCAAGQNPQSCAIRDSARAAAEQLEQMADEAEARLAAVDAQAAVFDQAVAASKATDPLLGASCIVSVTDIAVLAANVTELTLSDDRRGSVLLTGGVAPYYAEQPPRGWSVILSPSGRAEIAAPDTARGTETLSFYDGSARARSVVSVTVTVPAPKEKPPTPGAGDGAETTSPTTGPGNH